MIVKVQIPWVPVDAPALIYDERRKWMGVVDQSELPHPVRRAARGGKAYFYVEIVGSKISFGAEAPAQKW